MIEINTPFNNSVAIIIRFPENLSIIIPEKNPYDSYEDDDMYEDIHHIDDLMPLLKKIVKLQESQKLVLKDKMHVIVEPDDAKSLLFAYKELNEENKKKFSLNLFENKKQFWNMVSFSKSRGE